MLKVSNLVSWKYFLELFINCMWGYAMKYWFGTMSVILILQLYSGCASVPKESVALSQSIGKGLEENHRTHKNLLNKYFQSKKEEINKFIYQEYLPTFIKDFQALLKTNKMDTSLTQEQIKGIISRIITKRDQMQLDLEKTRIMIADTLDKQYILLFRANAQLTSFLESAIKNDEANEHLISTLQTSLNIPINLDTLEINFQESLKKAGENSKKIFDTNKDIQNLINPKESK